MVIRKIVIVIVQPVKRNFAIHKHYRLKLSTRKKQLATRVGYPEGLTTLSLSGVACNQTGN